MECWSAGVLSYPDVSGGVVVRGGVIPADRVDHAGVVHITMKLNLKHENLSHHLLHWKLGE